MALSNLLIVTGPTGIGKTSLAIKLAKELDTEIINADSVQVYKGFDIGSGKVTEDEKQGVKHHLLSYVEANQKFDVAKFCKDADGVIKDIYKRGKIPIVCGGTGMYLRALVSGVAKIPEIKESARAELVKLEKEVSAENLNQHLYSYLQNIDPDSAIEVNKSDIQRIKRAILVYLSSGKSITEYQKEHNFSDNKYNTLFVILKMDKEQLHQRINSRCKEMLELGLVKEVINLLSQYSLNSNAFSAIGYRHIIEYLRADYNFEKMLELLKRDTRRFAKRQRTWWRNQPRFLGWHNVLEEIPEIFQEGEGDSNLVRFCEQYFLDKTSCEKISSEKVNKISYIEVET